MPARPAPPLVSRRRVGHRWSQAVHHELRHGHHALRHRHGGDRRQRRAQEISTIIVPSGTPASRWARRTTRWGGTRPTPIR
jgi:hypothetical protein